MTAGIAAPRPAAVAISASEMPGATTARLAEPCWPMPWNAAMMPQTVPKSPMNGAALAVVAKDLEELDRLAANAAELPRLVHDQRPAHDREDEENDEDDLGDRPRVPDESEDAGVQRIGGHGPSLWFAFTMLQAL